MYNPFSLEGKNILITGASSGIGLSTAIECSRLGANVIITARNKDKLEETLNLMAGLNNGYFCADMSSDKDILKLIEFLPQLDGVVCNAGINKLSPIPFINDADLNELLRINTIAPILLVKSLIKKKKIVAKGSIVFTSSVSGIYTVAIAHSMYSATKGAINSFMKNAALELGPKQIRCNSVNPGMVETKLIHGGFITDEQLKEDVKNYPLGRYGKPEDVANGIIFLLSDASSWITGISLVIDGGFTLR